MNSDDKFALLVIGTPMIGLIYCGIGIALMVSNETIREHPLISGAIFILVPFVIAASIWIRASAKAYNHTNK
ncbi:MAG: hypothetical protein QNJ70_25815 [Xenococcaceae cyanobacterium MO_207.B15]|nr:hypothetical protein [Xenococcaceae cyanobacterium MO_207.B15]MDJ0744349.1 hypothetical protein [Xenococcaceae cyanobacterium MO_167.B27]